MPRKKGNGEGTIYHNGTYWVGQVTIGTNSETGKLKRKSIYGKTKRDVQEKVTALLNEVNTDTYIEPSKMTVREWSEYWYENFKKNQLGEKTQIRYESDFKNHIIKPFGTVPLKDLTAFHIQSYINSLQTRQLSYATIKSIYSYIKLLYRQAIKLELVNKNPCEGVTLPKANNTKPPRVLNQEEQKKLLEHCYSKEIYYVFILLLGTGLRISEALGLSWDNIDFNEDTIEVQNIMIEPHGIPKLKEGAKTKSGSRKVPLTPKMKALLVQVLNAQDKEKNIKQLVFPSPRYDITGASVVRHRLMRISKRLDIQHVNIHALRHTFATRMLEAGANIKVLSEILGHKNIQITLNTYAHVMPDLKKENMIKIDEFL